MVKRNLFFAALFFATMALSSISSAAQIAVSNVTASSTFGTYSLSNLTNGSGLTGSLHSGDWTTKWLTNQNDPGTLVFDLGFAYDLTSSSIWNYGNGCCGAGRSVKDLGVEASLDGITYFNIGSFLLNQPVGDPFAAESISLITTAQFVRFNLNSNYGDSYTGLSEVQFFGEAASVSEASSIALLGLGLMGLGISRRKKKML